MSSLKVSIYNLEALLTDFSKITKLATFTRLFTILILLLFSLSSIQIFAQIKYGEEYAIINEYDGKYNRVLVASCAPHGCSGPQIKHGAHTILHDGKKDKTKLWKLEYKSGGRGKYLQHEDIFYIKNVATGEYLGVCGEMSDLDGMIQGPGACSKYTYHTNLMSKKNHYKTEWEVAVNQADLRDDTEVYQTFRILIKERESGEGANLGTCGTSKCNGGKGNVVGTVPYQDNKQTGWKIQKLVIAKEPPPVIEAPPVPLVYGESYSMANEFGNWQNQLVSCGLALGCDAGTRIAGVHTIKEGLGVGNISSKIWSLFPAENGYGSGDEIKTGHLVYIKNHETDGYLEICGDMSQNQGACSSFKHHVNLSKDKVTVWQILSNKGDSGRDVVAENETLWLKETNSNNTIYLGTCNTSSCTNGNLVGTQPNKKNGTANWRFKRFAYEYADITEKEVFIKDIRSGGLLTINDYSTNSKLNVSGYTGRPAQQFRLVFHPEFKAYSIESTFLNSQVLGTTKPHNNKTDLAMSQWSRAPHQLWSFVKTGPDKYHIRNIQSGHVIQNKNGTGSQGVWYGQGWEITSSEGYAPIRYNHHMTIGVNLVEKANNQGHFRQIAPRLWQEEGPSGTFYREWFEIYRDEWSVHLRAKPGEYESIGPGLDQFDGPEFVQLDLKSNKIFRWTESDWKLNPVFDIQSSSTKLNGYMVSMIQYSSKNPSGEFERVGEYYRTGVNNWTEIRYSDNQKFEFEETNRDEWSVYLFDESRNLTAQLDLHTKQVHTFSVPFESSPRYITHTYGFNSPAEPGIISFPGGNQSVSIEALEASLAHDGFVLVQTEKLEKNQCALILPKADADDLTAEFGVLACAIEIDDQITMSIQAIHSSCDLVSLSSGIGSSCEGVIGTAELVFKGKDGINRKFELKGPSAEQCSSISTERLCGNLGASLGTVGISAIDENGNGMGLSLDAGVGAGFGAGYEEGVLSAGFDLKFGIGGSIEVSANLENVVKDPAVGVLDLAETAYTISGGAVRLAAEPLKLLNAEVFGEAAEVPNAVITVITDCPYDFMKYLFTMGREPVKCFGTRK